MSAFKRKRVSIKGRTIHELILLANRNTNRANRAKTKGDTRGYERYRKRSFRYRKEVSTRIGYERAQPITTLKGRPEAIESRRVTLQRRRETRKTKTEFKKVLKYKDKEGEIHKEHYHVTFKERESIDDFTEHLKNNLIPLKDEDEIFMYDKDDPSLNWVELIAFYGAGS